MPAAHTVTPEPVTNSGRGEGGGGQEGQGSGGEHLIGCRSGHLLSPHTGSIDCSLGFGRGCWLEDAEACLGGCSSPAAPRTSFLTSKMLLKYNTLSA